MSTYNVTAGIGLSPTLESELQRIARTLFTPTVSFLELVTHYAAPAKVYDGLVMKADGTSWNPGAGAGVYVYYGGAWNLMG